MTVTALPAVLAVSSRIAEITARFEAPAGVGAPSSGTRFATELGSASTRLGAGGSRAGTGTGSAVAGAPPLRSTAATAPSGADAVREARRYLGVPYVRGGDSPTSGLDCSGLTELVFSRVGVDLPSVSWEQVRSGRAVGDLSQARPGDLVFFGSPVHHVGIYLGGGRMIHAPRPGRSVEVSSVYETPSAIRRVLPDGPAAPAATGAGRTGGVAGPYADLFRRAGAGAGVPAALLSAVAKVESGHRADAVSPAGARGLMQIMPGTARELGVDPMDPAQAVDGAARLLKSHLRAFGSTELALAAYNAGAGAVRRYGGIPPYAETQDYVRKVMAAYTGGRR